MLLDNFIRVFTILIAFGAPATVIIVIAKLRYAQRMELIRRGMYTDDTLPRYPGSKSLFWGILCVGLGIAAIIYTMVNPGHSMMQFGFMTAGLGIALLIYWKVTGPERERLIRIYQERTREI